MIVKYETKSGEHTPGSTDSITPCPFDMRNALGEGPFMVGSFACRSCRYYSGNLKDYWGSVECYRKEKPWL